MHTTIDVSELASFVEVCKYAAGEEEFNMTRLVFLHNVGSNFASLIYELPDDADFDKFDENCKTVESFLESNIKLAESLVSTVLSKFMFTYVCCQIVNFNAVTTRKRTHSLF